MRKEQGFTLIELLIVLAILGILVGIVAMSVGDLTTTAVERGMKSEKEIVQTAIDTFNTQDAAVGGSSDVGDIGASGAAVQLTAGGTDYTKYLKRGSKYYYYYDSANEALTVCNSAACDDVTY